MKPLSQSEYGELRSLYENVYVPKFESILDEFTDEDLDDLTEEYIEEQVNEFFQECVEEGLDVDFIEDVLCESIDSSLELLSEVTNPAKVAAARMRDKASGGDKPKMNVSKQKVGGSSEKKASKLSMVKGAVKKAASAGKAGLKAAGKAAKGGVGLAARAVGTAQRAGSAVKSAAKSGYERGRQGSGGESSSSGSSNSSSSSGGGSSSSGSSGTSSSSGGSSSSSSSGGTSSASGGGSSAAPAKRKDGLLKRGLKKVVRGISKGVSAAAGAVKAGADSITDRARKEELEATGLFSEKEIEAIMEAEVQELYKGKHGQSEKEYQDSRSDAGKMVSGDSKGSGASYSSRSMKGTGPNPAGGSKKPAGQGRMTSGARTDLQFRKAALKKEEAEIDEAMSSYDRNRKRAAERAAARNAARDAGKTGAVPGVGYVTPRRERETYVDSAGTTRHKSGAKMPKD